MTRRDNPKLRTSREKGDSVQNCGSARKRPPLKGLLSEERHPRFDVPGESLWGLFICVCVALLKDKRGEARRKGGEELRTSGPDNKGGEGGEKHQNGTITQET